MMNLTIMETREMSKKTIERELRKRAKKLEEFGMTHEEACGFLSGVMNLGIAVNEKIHNK